MMERNVKRGMISLVVIVLLLTSYVAYQGFTAPSPGTKSEEGKNAVMIISLNFGEKEFLKKVVSPGESVLDGLKSIANVSTAYGGKFVTGINNITSDPENHRDWFYYVNGILANVGASDYIIKKGDVVRWDYHSWDKLSFVSAEIMDFPSMFTHGYGKNIFPLIIGYDAENEKYAHEMVEYFQNNGFKNVTIEPMEEIGSERSNVNLILIGQGKIVNNIMKVHTQLNLRYYTDSNYTVDYFRNTKFQGAFAEVIQSPFNPKGIGACENVILVITGKESKIPDVVHLLLNRKMQSFWCVVGEQ